MEQKLKSLKRQKIGINIGLLLLRERVKCNVLELDRSTLGISIALIAIVALIATVTISVPGRVKNVPLKSMVIRIFASHLVHYFSVSFDEQKTRLKFWILELVPFFTF